MYKSNGLPIILEISYSYPICLLFLEQTIFLILYFLSAVPGTQKYTLSEETKSALKTRQVNFK